jgi:hypothetical protein
MLDVGRLKQGWVFRLKNYGSLVVFRFTSSSDEPKMSLGAPTLICSDSLVLCPRHTETGTTKPTTNKSKSMSSEHSAVEPPLGRACTGATSPHFRPILSAQPRSSGAHLQAVRPSRTKKSPLDHSAHTQCHAISRKSQSVDILLCIFRSSDVGRACLDGHNA